MASLPSFEDVVRATRQNTCGVCGHTHMQHFYDDEGRHRKVLGCERAGCDCPKYRRAT